LTPGAKDESRPAVLVIGYGNPGRLDDGLGPALAAAIETAEVPGVDVDADYQLTVEDAAAVAEHEVVIFADAAVSGREPFYFRTVDAREDATFTTHSVSPEAILFLARTCFQAQTHGYVLGIRGYEFNEFGERLSPKALANLDAATVFLTERLQDGRFAQAVGELE